jgi:hypothetical protein
MNTSKSYFNTSIAVLLMMVTVPFTAHSQHTREEMMLKLEFLTGDWIGTATTLKNNSIISSNPAFEKVEYKLDKNILTIDLHSEPLQLHTIIYYDENDQSYYYNPFYKTGAATYPAQFVNGKLIVNPSNTKRFIFELTIEGKFREYGEQLIDGTWQVYFEDTFVKND